MIWAGFAAAAIIVGGSGGIGTSVPINAEIEDVTYRNVASSGISVSMEGSLSDQIGITVSAPNVRLNRDFRSFLTIEHGHEGTVSMVETRPELVDGHRHLNLYLTRFDGQIGDFELQIVYTTEGSAPLVVVVDLNSIYSARVSVQGESPRTN